MAAGRLVRIGPRAASAAPLRPPGRRRSAYLLHVALLAAVALLGSTACSQDPQVRKQASLERGEKYLKDHKINEAIIELRKALQVDPDFAPALRALGRAYAQKAWYLDAWRELARAQKIMPHSLPIAIDLANVLLELCDWVEAETQD